MRKNNKGFSLAEFVIVIAILGALVGVIAPNYLKYVDRSKRAMDVANAKQIADVMKILFISEDAGAYPDTFTWDKNTSIDGNDIYKKMFQEFGDVPISEFNEDLMWRIYYGVDTDGYYSVKKIYMLESSGDTMAYELYPNSETFLGTGEKVALAMP